MQNPRGGYCIQDSESIQKKKSSIIIVTRFFCEQAKEREFKDGAKLGNSIMTNQLESDSPAKESQRIDLEDLRSWFLTPHLQCKFDRLEVPVDQTAKERCGCLQPRKSKGASAGSTQFSDARRVDLRVDGSGNIAWARRDERSLLGSRSYLVLASWLYLGVVAKRSLTLLSKSRRSFCHGPAIFRKRDVRWGWFSRLLRRELFWRH